MSRGLIEVTFPAPLDPPNTGNADADEAITKLRTFPKRSPAKWRRPSGEEYDALVARAEAVGPEKLLELLDDATIQTGNTVWDDEQIDALPAKERRKFKKDHTKAGPEIKSRLAYLHWLVGATCNTEAGFERALEILKAGSAAVRDTTMSALMQDLEGDPQRLQVAAVFDLREWDGEELGNLYRAGLELFCELASPAEVYERYGDLAEDGAVRRTLLAGLAKAEALDPRWVPVALAAVGDLGLRHSALKILEHFEPDESWVEPFCAALPDPTKPGSLTYKDLLAPLAKVGDARALPYFMADLRRGWMSWEVCFEGLRKIGDPAGAHAVRDFLEKFPGTDRNEVGAALIAELEKDGAVPRMEVAAEDSKPTRTRPVLTYEKGPKPKHPNIEPLAELEKVYAKAFTDAGLEGAYEKLAQRAVLMLPTRVKEAELEVGATKLGGHPDLPAKTKWPRVSKEPLTFLAQVDLGDVAPLLPKGALPTEGLLSFFIGNDFEGPAGYCEKAKVVFTEPGAELVRREVPKDFYDVIYQAARVELVATVTLPSPSNKHVGKVLRGKKRDTYEEVFEACDAFEPLLPQLLGFRRHGWDAEEPGTSEMLLQLPGDDQTGMQFGDIDVLGIYVARKRLEAGDFSKVRPRLGDG
ncbi:MAG: DUF1963 domain-containing protein [Deltaproteobacteria bacterium]|nr:DUF1963 domain-containing protein [Deltaproteobacteria bacterium]